MVAEPCATPYTGACHIGSRDRCERLDGAASIFRPTSLEDSSASARASSFEESGIHVEDGNMEFMFTFSSEEAEYINTLLEPDTVAWLGTQGQGIDPAARITTAIPQS